MSSDSSDTRKKKQKEYSKVQWTDTEDDDSGDAAIDSEEERRNLLQKSANESLFGWVDIAYGTKLSPGDLRYSHDFSWELSKYKQGKFNPY